MLVMKILLVEDVEETRKEFLQSVVRFNHENNTDISVDECDNLESAIGLLDRSYDGAVIDMKLGDVGGEGNEILRMLDEKRVRMPVVILTGTPNEADPDFVHIEVQKKGEADYLAILEDFRQIHASGLTNVMGGRGLLEELLSKVYKTNILSQKGVWKKYGQIDPKKSEKALMRHVMSHLIQMVDLDQESCVPEEFYLAPPVDDALRTGSVVQHKESSDFFAIMNPLCDLTVRINGVFNARKILLCKIASFDECAGQLPAEKQNANGRSSLRSSLSGNKKSAYHALPKTEFFDGGYLDFEFLVSIQKDQFEAEYQKPLLQIAPAFTKDIVARFSAYYGRQGQPTLTHVE